MGRITQLFNYINEKKSPQSEEVKSLYTHIELTKNLKKARKKYRSKK